MGAWTVDSWKITGGVLSLGTIGAIASASTPSAPSPDTGKVQGADTAQQEYIPVVTTETTTETEAIPFDKTSVDSDSYAKGTSQVTTTGVNGVRTITYKITKSDNIEVSKEKIKEEVTTAPVDEVTTVGTYVVPVVAAPVRSSCNPNYSPCVPNVSYDLDCSDIGFSVAVIGSDPYRLDADHDGLGCESY